MGFAEMATSRTRPEFTRSVIAQTTYVTAEERRLAETH